ncbi:CoA-transferase [Saccharopolyspora tripterygii]
MVDQDVLEYTPNELAVAILARQMRDDEMGFVGVGSSGRAFSLAAGIPLVASRLAQLTSAPHFNIQIGPVINPQLDVLPPRWNDSTAYDVPALGFIDAIDNIEALLRGGVDLAFVSGAQVDRYGNLNITEVGTQSGKRRLVGALALPEHQAFAKRTIILVDQKQRTFVEKVDFITGVGHLDGESTRTEAGLNPGGPELVITDMATFDFVPTTRRMRLRTVHPGFAVEDVLANMGFTPDLADDVGITEPPSAEALRLIRRQIDPDRLLLAAEPAGRTTKV